ncbi:MAG: EF-P lysine aminoacylase EpmA [Victivallaceae bacterium]|nr:EF-P lysine aminoacylase EpmA [Victivallaceae bacterium]MDD4180504.1 EF-P lysine aminoacylase EpmA [Victivallaceae bacterium]
MLNVFPKPKRLQTLGNIQARLAMRAGLFSHIRSFFERNNFVAIETPIRIKAPAPEEFIEAPRSGEYFLRCSPELEMKQLLCAGFERIYQIGACFRENERGKSHREEFTMLEWYEVGVDYCRLLEFTTAMLRDVSLKISGTDKINFRGIKIDLGAEPEIITVNDAYLKYAKISSAEALRRDIFDEVMDELIEPELGQGRMTFLLDYPACRASLARLKPDSCDVAERWELYIGGLELANAYSELTDAKIQRSRFAAEAAARTNTGMNLYPEPTEFLEALDYGLPECSGCALGMDRLAMVFSNATDISEVTLS